jgi:hypothetical protein
MQVGKESGILPWQGIHSQNNKKHLPWRENANRQVPRIAIESIACAPTHSGMQSPSPSQNLTTLRSNKQEQQIIV